jgi:hypothetical protein
MNDPLEIPLDFLFLFPNFHIEFHVDLLIPTRVFLQNKQAAQTVQAKQRTSKAAKEEQSKKQHKQQAEQTKKKQQSSKSRTKDSLA